MSPTTDGNGAGANISANSITMPTTGPGIGSDASRITDSPASWQTSNMANVASTGLLADWAVDRNEKAHLRVIVP
jgi:hypothetical protein